MREILFRGKCDGGWKHGSLHIEQGETDQHGNSSLDYRILGMRGECYYVIPETVGQYAGVTDENGTKIFEGDILLVKYSDFVGNDAECRVFLTDMTDFEVMGRIDTANEVEVIGNIHDNPELLEGVK